jgi:hypothetical protein
MPTSLDLALVRLESEMDEGLQVGTPADRRHRIGHHEPSRPETGRAKETDTD